MSTESIHGVDLRTYAAMGAHLIGLPDADAMYAALAAKGYERSRWEKVDAGWRARLGDPDLQRQYFHLLKQALAAECGQLSDYDLEDYIADTVAAYGGSSQADIAAQRGIGIKELTLHGYRWLDRLAADPRLDTEVKLRMQRGLAEAQGQAPFRDQTRWTPGSKVRRRKCHRCGALKTTPPRTALVYCDYCGVLFDVDPTIAVSDPAALDPAMVEDALAGVTEADMGAAFAKGDRQRYAELARWRTEVEMAVSPATHSPRIGDAEYRRRLLDVTADWMVALRWEPGAKEKSEATERAEIKALRRQTLASVLELLAASRDSWSWQIAVLEREGILARHPDELDRDLMMRLLASQFCRRWLPFVRGDDADRLLEAAGVAELYVDAPMPDLKKLSCAHCKARIEAPDGAHRKMCESCGYVLDLDQRAVPCTSCGATIAMAARETTTLEHECAYCGSHWSL